MRWVTDARALACVLSDRENTTGPTGPTRGAP